MGDVRVPVGVLLSAFGVAATVTRPAPDNAPIPTTGIWFKPGGSQQDELQTQPYGTDLRRWDSRRLIALPRSEVATLPNGTTIAAPEDADGAVKTWRVDGLAPGTDSEFWQAIVKPEK